MQRKEGAFIGSCGKGKGGRFLATKKKEKFGLTMEGKKLQWKKERTSGGSRIEGRL